MSHTTPPPTPFDLANAAHQAAITCLKQARSLLDLILNPDSVDCPWVALALHYRDMASRYLERCRTAFDAAEAFGLPGHCRAYLLLLHAYRAVERGSRGRADHDEIATVVARTVQAAGLVRLSDEKFEELVFQIEKERRELIPHLVLLAEHGRLPNVPVAPMPTGSPLSRDPQPQRAPEAPLAVVPPELSAPSPPSPRSGLPQSPGAEAPNNGDHSEDRTTVESLQVNAALSQAYLSGMDLARTFEVPAEALRKRLERWRRNNRDRYRTQVDRHRNAPTYTYQVNAVRAVIEDLRQTHA
jgi:hypothetical protein